MKRGGIVFWLILALCFSKNIALSQNISNEGTDFWAVFPSHDPSNTSGVPNLANLRIYITSKTNSEVTVTCGAFNSGLVTVNPGTPSFVDIPRAAAYIDHSQSNTILASKGIHIQVSPGKGKVAVYEHIYAGARSAASLILPHESLGQNYYSMNFTQDASGGSRNFLVLVATEANTKLLIHHNNTIIPVSFTAAGEVYQYIGGAQEDLTGTYVEVDPASPDYCNKRFAAYSGSTSLLINCASSRDPLFQQLYPTSTWGKSYGIVPFANRRHFVRILAQEDNTTVQFEGQVISLNKGQYYQNPAPSSSAGLVLADKMVSVAQYSLTQSCSAVGGGALIGDPEMVLLNPIEFNIKSVTLFSSTLQNIAERYINVFIKTSAAPTFRINGVLPSNGFWSTLPSDPTYSYIQISIDDVSSNLTASEGFNAVAYGFGNAESYAYSAGTNLATNNYLLVNNKITNLDAPTACLGQASDFKLILPAPATSLKWQLDNGSPVSGSTNPSNIVDSPTGKFYEYTYAANITFNNVSRHTMKVSVEFASTGGCLGAQDSYEYQFDVDPVPVADFKSDKPTYCEMEAVQFSDASNSLNPGKPINKWQWDFGDGTTSVEQNPSHQYQTANQYAVKLSAGVDDGCMSEVFSKTLTVLPAPKVTFDAIPPMCISDGATKIRSATVVNAISGTATYSGPGIIDVNGAFDPAVAGAGTHIITFSYKNLNNCEDVKTQTVTVSPLPVLIFDKDIYILKGGQLRLKIEDDGQKSTYKWSPSDGLLDNENVLNPTVSSGTEDRQYTLTVATEGGCIISETLNVHVVNNLEPSNAFSPNDDGINDIWVIRYIETYPTTSVQIFNRHGEVVYTSKSYSQQPFDGRYQGKPLPVGTYFYIIDPKNGQARLTGSLTIIR